MLLDIYQIFESNKGLNENRRFDDNDALIIESWNVTFNLTFYSVQIRAATAAFSQTYTRMVCTQHAEREGQYRRCKETRSKV